MTSTLDQHGQHELQHGHPAPRRRGIFMRPGYLRALWVTPLFFLIGMYIVVALRALAGWDPVYDWEYIVLVADAKKAGEPEDQYIEQSIVDPNAVIVSGYQPGVMPTTFGKTLSPAELSGLVAFLSGKEAN